MYHGNVGNQAARLHTTWLRVIALVGPHCHGYRYHARFLDYTPVGVPLQLVTHEYTCTVSVGQLMQGTKRYPRRSEGSAYCRRDCRGSIGIAMHAQRLRMEV